MARILVLALAFLITACTTVITEDPPKNVADFAEVDVPFSAGAPDLTVYRIWSQDRMALEDYEERTEKPMRFFLRTGNYRLVLNCNKVIVMPDGSVIHSVLTDISPGFEFHVEAGSKYELGCNPADESDGYYIRKK